jgi:hypothetical protein
VDFVSPGALFVQGVAAAELTAADFRFFHV